MQRSQADRMPCTSATEVIPAALPHAAWTIGLVDLANVCRRADFSQLHPMSESVGVDCLLVGLAGCRQMQPGPFTTSHLVP